MDDWNGVRGEACPKQARPKQEKTGKDGCNSTRFFGFNSAK